MYYPFKEHIKQGKMVRVFTPDIDDNELKWHQDFKDRKVTIVEDGGWSFQIENFLPIKLSETKEFDIPKLAWHRVIKGHGNLIVEIEEF